ncbi:MAG: hypothetical protein Q4D26_06395 [Clostridia bacterium]|nr:hypothetical protein [Clostridia bacterium]
MACFVVPAVEAVVTTVATKVIEKKENKGEAEVRTGFSGKLKWLNKMLWGGSALLAFEHLWHGEIVPWFPFLTNAVNPVNRAEMLHEMATGGVGMTVLVTVVWAVMVIASNALVKRTIKQEG